MCPEGLMLDGNVLLSEADHLAVEAFAAQAANSQCVLPSLTSVHYFLMCPKTLRFTCLDRLACSNRRRKGSPGRPYLRHRRDL
jgi:hypothetical protein